MYSAISFHTDHPRMITWIIHVPRVFAAVHPPSYRGRHAHFRNWAPRMRTGCKQSSMAPWRLDGRTAANLTVIDDTMINNWYPFRYLMMCQWRSSGWRSNWWRRNKMDSVKKRLTEFSLEAHGERSTDTLVLRPVSYYLYCEYYYYSY